MKKIFVFLLILFMASVANADIFASPGGEISFYTVANLPSSPVTGDVAGVSDGADASDCDTGGGSDYNLCIYDGSNWVIVGDGTAAAASGDSFTVNSVGADTTANLIDSANVTWTLTDGGAGGPDDISAALSIALTTLSDVNSSTATAGRMLVANGSTFDSVALSGDVTIASSGATTIQANSVALTTDTTGNYVATLADAGNSTVTVTNGSAEGGAATIDVIDVNCSDCIGAAEISDFGTMTATAGNIPVADGSDFESVAMSGDVTIDSTGATKIQGISPGIIYIDGTNYARTNAGIESAITALPAGGGIIYLTEGTYTLTGDVTISKDNVKIEGPKSAILFLANSTNTNIINVNGADFVTLMGFTINGNKANQSSNGKGVTTAASAHYLYVYDLYVHDTNDDGLYANISHDVTFEKNTIIDAGAYGMQFASNYAFRAIDNNIIDPTKSGIYAAGTTTYNSSHFDISGNIITGVGTDQESGIHVFEGEDGKITGNIIFDFADDTNGRNGIFARGISGNAEFLIEGNVIEGVSGVCIELSTNAGGTTISNNECTLSGTGGDAHCIFIDEDADECTIDGNYLNNCTQHGLYFDEDSINHRAVNNTIKNPQNGAGIRGVITTAVTGGYLDLSDNTIIDDQGSATMTYGMQFSASGGGAWVDVREWNNDIRGFVTGRTTGLPASTIVTESSVDINASLTASIGTFETSLEVPNGAAPTTDDAGEIALDTTITDHQPLLQYYDGGENMTVIAIDTSELPALDNEIVKYDAISDKFVLEADATSGGGLTSLSDVSSATATAGRMLVADGSDWESVAISGDVTIDANGVTYIQANSVALGTDTTGNYAGSASEGGAATTATALAANGANCNAGEYALGVDASGAVESCTDATTEINTEIGNVLDGTDAFTDFNGNVIETDNLPDFGTLTDGAGRILINDAADFESVAVTGDVTIGSDGVVAIGADKVKDTMVDWGTGAGQVSATDLPDFGTMTATAANILLGDGSDFDSVAVTGDVTLDSTGETSVASGTKKRVFISASAGMCLTTGGCADATQAETATNNVNYFHCAFDGATDEKWQATFTMPENYDAGTITAAVEWSGTHTAGDTVRWDVSCMSITDDDVLDTAFGTAQSVDDDTTATGDFQRTDETSAITCSGSPAGGHRIWVQVNRDANNAADDDTDDAKMLGIWLTFGIDALSTED